MSAQLNLVKPWHLEIPHTSITTLTIGLDCFHFSIFFSTKDNFSYANHCSCQLADCPAMSFVLICWQIEIPIWISWVGWSTSCQLELSKADLSNCTRQTNPVLVLPVTKAGLDHSKKRIFKVLRNKCFLDQACVSSQFQAPLYFESYCISLEAHLPWNTWLWIREIGCGNLPSACGGVYEGWHFGDHFDKYIKPGNPQSSTLPLIGGWSGFLMDTIIWVIWAVTNSYNLYWIYITSYTIVDSAKLWWSNDSGQGEFRAICFWKVGRRNFILQH